MIIPDEVKQLARAGKDKKIQAIHLLRKATGISLKLAKEAVETIAAGGEVQLATPGAVPSSGETREERLQRQLEAFAKAGRVSVPNNEWTEKLLEVLQSDEDLLDLARGAKGDCSGILLTTQRRLLFLRVERSFGPACDRFLKRFGISPAWGNVEAVPALALEEEFPLESIYLVYHRAGLHESSIKIFMSDFKRAEFTNMEKDSAMSFARDLQARVEIRYDEFGQLSPEDQVEALFDHGIISTEELADRKRKILKKIRQQTGRQPRRSRKPS